MMKDILSIGSGSGSEELAKLLGEGNEQRNSHRQKESWMKKVLKLIAILLGIGIIAGCKNTPSKG